MENNKLTIKEMKGRRVFDSQGFSTIEVEIQTEEGIKEFASAPRGSTKGNFETHYIEEYLNGKDKSPDVSKAVYNVNTIMKDTFVGKTFTSIEEFDEMLLSLDKEKSKKNIGGNCILAASYAAIKLFSKLQNQPMYSIFGTKSNGILPMVNIIDGSKNPKSKLVGLEVLLIPEKNKFKSISNIIEIISNIVVSLKKRLYKQGYFVEVSKQGALSFLADDVQTCLDYLKCSVEDEGFTLQKDFSVGLDMAMTDYYDIESNTYNVPWLGNKISGKQLICIYDEWVNKYHVSYIEDGLADSDYQGWKDLYEKLGSKIMISGDDLFATNTGRLEKYYKIVNTVVVKPNQIGTLLETKEFIEMCKKKEMKMVVSQRTGETEDVIITHIGVGYGLNYLKAGGVNHMERIAKFNELIRIYE